jgi:hypothetical protein
VHLHSVTTAAAKLVVALPIQQLRSPARQCKQLLIYTTQYVPKAAQLIFHGIKVVCFFDFKRKTGLLFPVPHEVPLSLYPTISLNDVFL